MQLFCVKHVKNYCELCDDNLKFYSHTLDGGDFVSLLYKEVDDFEVYAYHQNNLRKSQRRIY